MKTEKRIHNHDALDQLGGTDQIEQLAADLAIEKNRDQVTDNDRHEALHQMGEMAVPSQKEPAEDQDHQQKSNSTRG